MTNKEAIYRQDVLDLAKKGVLISNGNYESVCKAINEIPSAEPKTGHWKWVQYDYNPKIGNWHCSECRCVVVECVGKEEKGGIPLYKYCPQCGAKMFEPQERSDKE